jgi:hypothetical protein
LSDERLAFEIAEDLSFLMPVIVLLMNSCTAFWPPLKRTSKAFRRRVIVSSMVDTMSNWASDIGIVFLRCSKN